MENWLGKKLGEYRLHELIGRGGVTAVFRGHTEERDQSVIVKVVDPQFQVEKARFLAWGHAAATLHHPHLAPILAYGWHETTGYWARPHDAGISLHTLLQRLARGHYQLALADILRLGQQITIALDYLHHQNEIHGAIHPNNVWLKPQPDDEAMPWQVSLLDSTVWAILSGRQPDLLTAFPALWPYAAPEQTQGFTPSPTTDLYNLTALLHHLITGQPPFNVHSLDEARYLHQQTAPPTPGSFRRHLSARVSAVIHKGLAKQPERRLQSANHLRTALQQLLETEPLTGGESIRDWFSEDVPPLASPSPTLAELIISREGSNKQSVVLDKPVLTLGRSHANDVYLSEEGVSRHHARVEWLTSGWHLVDLDSTNGISIGEEKLRPRQPHRWLPDEPAQLSGYTLRWRTIHPGDQKFPETPLPPPPVLEPPVSAAEHFQNVFAFAFGESAAAEREPAPPETPRLEELAPDIAEEVGMSTAAAIPSFSPPIQPPIIEPRTPAEPMSGPPLIEPMTPVSPLPVPLVRLTLVPSELEIVPGKEAFIQVIIANQGHQAERFYLRVEGLPADWVSIPENQLLLEAGAQDILQINIMNTLDKTIEPGQRTFIVRVSPETAPDIISVATGHVHIKECISFAATLEPERVRPRVPCLVHIHNLGNTETAFSIMARSVETDAPLEFVGQAGRVVLAPGEQGSLPLTIETPLRPLWGRRQNIPFRVQIRASHGDSQIKLGQLEIVPVLSLWSLVA
ncbi:MAG: FHA domain-containing protein [Chloroflexi bacterium]|nr:FHA domain-containing protein [Chloroflexota bacterium]